LKREQKQPITKVQPEVKKPQTLGWLIVFGPMTIIIFLLMSGKLPWVEDQSDMGRRSEALDCCNIGRESLKDCCYNDAARKFANAIYLDPDLPDPYIHMGVLHIQTGNDSMALKCLKKASELNPNRKDIIYNNLGLIHSHRGNYDKALRMYYAAVKYEIQAAPIWRSIGELEMKRENFTAAIDAYHKVIELWPTLKNLYTEMLRNRLFSVKDSSTTTEIKTRLEAGITDADLQSFNPLIAKKFIRSNPKFIYDWINLALAYEQNNQVDMAIKQIRKAQNLWPNVMIFHNQIGIIHAKTGNYMEAEVAFEKALKLDPGNPSITKNPKRLRNQTSR